MTKFYVQVKQPTEQYVEAETKLINYLQSLRKEVVEISGSDEVVNIAKNYWDYLAYKLPFTELLKVPDCWLSTSIDDEACIRFQWNRDEHYLSCEVFADTKAEFFYRNRFTNEVAGEDCIVGQQFPSIILDKLTLFTE